MPNALLIQMAMFDQVSKVLFERVSANARQFNGIADGDAVSLWRIQFFEFLALAIDCHARNSERLRR